jgi:hypothetical protein
MLNPRRRQSRPEFYCVPSSIGQIRLVGLGAFAGSFDARTFHLLGQSQRLGGLSRSRRDARPTCRLYRTRLEAAGAVAASPMAMSEEVILGNLNPFAAILPLNLSYAASLMVMPALRHSRLRRTAST